MLEKIKMASQGDKYESRYSGPGKAGICKCGHPWHEHHLGIVMNLEYFKATGEGYVPQECEHYGCNECGGEMPNPTDPTGEWVYHCDRYEDRGIGVEEKLLKTRMGSIE